VCLQRLPGNAQHQPLKPSKAVRQTPNAIANQTPTIITQAPVITQIQPKRNQQPPKPTTRTQPKHAPPTHPREYFDKYRRHVYVTPKSYLSFIQGYKELYARKWAYTRKLAASIQAGLQKMVEAKEDVNKMKAELAVKNQVRGTAAAFWDWGVDCFWGMEGGLLAWGVEGCLTEMGGDGVEGVLEGVTAGDLSVIEGDQAT